jgi:hypothetical protein
MRTRILPIRAVFRVDDPDATVVLRLVLAANDLGILFRMMFALIKPEGRKGSYREALNDAARHYVVRMGTLHLPDVWQLINSSDYRRVEERVSRRIPQIHNVSERFKETINRGPRQYVVAGMRNSFAGHPDSEAIQQALSIIPPSEMMEIPISTDGLGDHFNVTDRLYGAVLVDKAHAKYKKPDAEESARALLNELIDAQLALRSLAGALLAGMYLDMMKP